MRSGWEQARRRGGRAGTAALAALGIIAVAALVSLQDGEPASVSTISVHEGVTPTGEVTASGSSAARGTAWHHLYSPAPWSRPLDAVVTDDFLLVWFAGEDDAVTAWSLDLHSRQWSRATARRAAPLRGQAALFTGDSVVAWGGTEPAGVTLRPGADRWETTAPAPIPVRRQHGMAWDPASERLYVWGGRRLQPPGVVGDGAVWDRDSDTWAELPPAPIPGREDPFVTWTGDELLVWGGHHGGRPLQDGARFDPATGRWQPLPPTPVAYTDAPAVTWAGTDLVVWGHPEQAHRPPGWSLDPATGVWRPLPRLIGERRVEPEAAAAGGAVLIWGGTDPWSEVQRDDGFVLRPDGRWRTLPPAPLAPREEPLVAWTDAGLVVWGGRADRTPLSDGALYPAEKLLEQKNR